MSIARFDVATALTVLVLLASNAHGLGCLEQPGGAAFVGATKSAMDRHCPCETASNTAAYVKCVKGIVKAQVRDGLLPSTCAALVARAAKLSACGHADTVLCCTTSVSGKRSVDRRPSHTCIPKSGEGAVVGLTSSPLDACPVLPTCGSQPGFNEEAVGGALQKAVATLESSGFAFDMGNLAHRDVLFHQIPVELGCALVMGADAVPPRPVQ